MLYECGKQGCKGSGGTITKPSVVVAVVAAAVVVSAPSLSLSFVVDSYGHSDLRFVNDKTMGWHKLAKHQSIASTYCTPKPTTK